MKIKTLFLVILVSGLVFFSEKINAQDIHYSQFHAMPLLQNPALTGHIAGKFRLNLIYRNQWLTINSPGIYNTPGLSGDINIPSGVSRNSWGMGFFITNDQSASGAVRKINGGLSGAYHFNLDAYEKHYLSVGIQAGMIYSAIDFTKLNFGSQFNGLTIDESLPSLENIENDSQIIPDLKAGITWSSYFSDRFNLKVGWAYFNLIEPKEVFSITGELPARMAFHGEMEISVGNKMMLVPRLNYMIQAGASNATGHLVWKYAIGSETQIAIGGGLRNGDAVIGLLGFEIKGIQINLGYDHNISGLNVATNGVGALEIGVQYTGKSKPKAEAYQPAIRFY